MPSYAVISVGEDNSYGHPDDNTLSRLRDADVTIYRTDLHGDIVISSDGKTVSVVTDKSASADAVMKPGGSVVTEPTQEPETTTTPTTEPEQPTTNSVMVWIPNSGSKYHSKSSCSNMKNPTQVTLEEAERRGFTPCKKCY
jgi:competence protein ComEC